MQPHLHPAAEAGPAPEDLPGEPARVPAGSSEDRFNLLLPRVVAQVVGEGEPAREALRFGAAAAALKCARPGGIAGAPTRAAVEALLSRP